MTHTPASVSIEIRIPYADTDQMGVVYYANYLVYFERGRTEWLRQHGMSYKDLEAQGVYLPVLEANCRYKSSARYDDIIMVRTTIEKLGSASVEFQCEVLLDNKILAVGHTKHPFVNKDFKPVRIPHAVRAVLEGKAAVV